ncbi:S-layer homology domain-containing protein [Planococcus sp. 4-30]|uniref:S-layer homology domain-containing protein n=1 Tax=Planococcus sp. 4-30 TaxID=2874583 RepID=UPI001CC0BA8E|nr:S-layer homology domain-containing protein [Planococcus sp. 4-30]
MKKTSKLMIKGFLAAVLLVSLTVGNAGNADASQAYPDVPKTHKSEPNINFLTRHGIISGFTDNTFRPETPVTRAEASRIIVGGADALGIKYPAKNKRPMIKFTDLKTEHWYSKPIQSMYENRLINGFPNKSFRPGDTVTKAQLARMISDAFQMENATNVKLKYTDVKINGWYEQAVKNLFAAGVITDQGTQFKPNHKMTRAEVSDYIAEAMLDNGAIMDDRDEEIVPWDGSLPN